MKIIVVNVNTSQSMTEIIAEGARRYASPGTQTVALRPFFGPEAVDCNFESYLSAVGVMDRVLAYDEPFDAVVLAGFGEHGRDGLQELLRQPVVEICEASAQVAMLVARSYSVVTTLQRSVPAIEDRLKLAGLLDRCASIRASGMSTLELDADLCILAPDESFSVDQGQLYHKHPATTPYLGRRLYGVVRASILRGQEIDLGQPRGQLLSRATRPDSAGA